MTHRGFLELSQEKQLEAIRNQGVYLCKRDEEAYSVFLFQIDGFYVEAFYQRYHRAIRHLRSFQTTHLLTPYLKQISLKHLY